MNALHLLWIVPVAFCFGFFWVAVLSVGKNADNKKNGKK